MVFGSSANSSRRIRLYGASRSRAKVEDGAGGVRVGLVPGASATNAFGTASRTGSGLGTTAASATAACSMQHALELERQMR